MKLRITSMIQNIRKKKRNQSEQQEDKRFKKKQTQKQTNKNEDGISSLWDNLKRSNIHLIQAPEGEEKEQEFGNLFEKVMKENFPNLVKEIDMQVQEAQSPKQDGCKEASSKTHCNYNAKIKRESEKQQEKSR